MRTPVLETERLILRPLSVDDAETIYQNDGEYYSWDKSRRFECKEYILIVE